MFLYLHQKLLLGTAAANLKRQSRKKLRHTKDLPLRGNGFHKCFDYWWLHD